MTAENRSAQTPATQPTTSVTIEPGADGREIVFTRIIDAPRELVFKAWTEPKHLAQWWGPRGMTNPVCEVDLRPGGAYRIVMRSPDGVDYPVRGVYLEIVESERLVFTIAAHDHPAEWQDRLNQYRPKEDAGPDLKQVWTVTFEEHDGKTKLPTRNRFESVADRDGARKMGHAEGAAQSLDRLAEHLAKASPARRSM